MSSKKTLFEEALDNIRNDRNQAQFLLTKLLEFINKNDTQVKDAAFMASKYLETLQKSNEQLVKVAEILKKDNAIEELSDDDKEDLYDQLEDK